MIRRILVLATAAAVALTVVGIAPAQATVPDITAITASPTTIYPLIANAKRPGFTTITVTGNNTSTVDHLEVRNAATTNVRILNLNGGSSVNWDGRDGVGVVVPAGSYTVVAIGAGSDVSPFTATITVSTKKLIHKTYTHVFTAAGSLAATYVGRCSVLKKPSKRKIKGSLGYYANTKCKTQTFKASAVSTVHGARVPGAERYTDVQVNVVGGAATSKPGSRGLLRYANTNGDWVKEKFVGSKFAAHAGPKIGAAGIITPDRFFFWGFVGAFKSNYDVAKFTLVVHYDVLG